jgi:hypothetical protein
MIWDNFHYLNIPPNFTDFELNRRFPFEFEFLENWSLREIPTTNINPPVLKLGLGILHDGLQTLLPHLVGMHRLNPYIE